MNDLRRIHVETFPPRRRMARFCRNMSRYTPWWAELLALAIGGGFALLAVHWGL